MLDIIVAFWEKNWLSGGKVENVLGIISAFCEKNWLLEIWYQDQHWLSAKTSIFGLKSWKRARYYRRFVGVGAGGVRKHARYYRRVLREKFYLGGKSRKCARYYKRVLREKLTFETLISGSTLIIGQNTNFWPKKSNGQNTNFLPKQSKTCSIL